MERLLGVLNLAAVGNHRLRRDDDTVDRLSHRYTTFILVVFAVVVTTKQYVGEPISCWVPAQFTSNYVDYANKICWVSNTYYIPFSVQDVPKPWEERLLVNYYQWVPMILLFQALLFHSPCMVWRFMNNKAGINLTNVVEAGALLQQMEHHESRGKIANFMAKQVDLYLGQAPKRRKGCWELCKHCLVRQLCFCCNRSSGQYLTIVYLLVKVLYLLNACAQLFLLNFFLKTDYHLYGYEVFMQWIRGRDWTGSRRFPYVTMCDFQIRMLAHINKYTVQCVLPINLFNEKIFLFIWFWIALVAVFTFLNLITWFLRTVFHTDHVCYIKYALKAGNFDVPHGQQVKKLSSQFVSNYLRLDGVLILRLVDINSNSLVVTELCTTLWKHFLLSHVSVNCNGVAHCNNSPRSNDPLLDV